MGDFVKGSSHTAYPAVLQKGIHLHRQIDKFTDAHPLVKCSKKRIRKELGRFSGILVDVFYDHFLAINWRSYSSTEFEAQLEQWIELLAATQDYPLPERLQWTLKAIAEGGMLHSYKSKQGVEYALTRISARIRFANNLADGIQDFHDCYGALEQDFNCFFPELISFVDSTGR